MKEKIIRMDRDWKGRIQYEEKKKQELRNKTLNKDQR